jgi:hypothetical protein
MATVILIRQYFPSSPISSLLYHYALRKPQSISNVYLYVLNNPVNWVDPEGTIGIIPSIIIISGTWVIAGYIGEFLVWYPLYRDLTREIARTRKQMAERTTFHLYGFGDSQELQALKELEEYLDWLRHTRGVVVYRLGVGYLEMYLNLILPSVTFGAEADLQKGCVKNK